MESEEFTVYVAITTEMAPVVPMREHDDPIAFLPVYLDREIAEGNHPNVVIEEYTLTRTHREERDTTQ